MRRRMVLKHLLLVGIRRLVSLLLTSRLLLIELLLIELLLVRIIRLLVLRCLRCLCLLPLVQLLLIGHLLLTQLPLHWLLLLGRHLCLRMLLLADRHTWYVEAEAALVHGEAIAVSLVEHPRIEKQLELSF